MGALLTVTRAACTSGIGSSGPGSPGTGTSGGESGQAVDGAPADVPAFRVERSAVKAGSDGESVSIGPAKGGTLTVALPSGAIATLVFVGGAVDVRTSITMSTFGTGAVEGVAIEPAGTWLAIPAKLTFTNTDRTVAIRVGSSADGGALFAAAALGSDGAVPIVRLRPVVLLGVEVGALPLARGYGGGADTEDEAADPLDSRAANEEAGEAEEPGGDTGDEEVKQEAGGRVSALAGQCGREQPQVAGQVLEAWRTAGSVGAPPPECVRLRASVLAAMEADWSGGHYKPWQEVVHATGSGVAVDRIADLDLPAEREVTSFTQLYSLFFTGAAQAIGDSAGIAVPRMTADACTTGAIPQGSVRLETVPLPDQQMRVTITTRHGSYSIICDGQSLGPIGSIAWDTIRDLTGTAEGQPIVLTLPASEHVERVLSKVKAYEGARAKHSSDGTVRFRQEQYALSANFLVDLTYEPAT